MMDFHGTKCKLFLIYVVMDLRVAILWFTFGKSLFHGKKIIFLQ